jgi:hypothetical protein
MWRHKDGIHRLIAAIAIHVDRDIGTTSSKVKEGQSMMLSKMKTENKIQNEKFDRTIARE